MKVNIQFHNDVAHRVMDSKAVKWIKEQVKFEIRPILTHPNELRGLRKGRELVAMYVLKPEDEVCLVVFMRVDNKHKCCFLIRPTLGAFGVFLVTLEVGSDLYHRDGPTIFLGSLWMGRFLLMDIYMYQGVEMTTWSHGDRNTFIWCLKAKNILRLKQKVFEFVIAYPTEVHPRAAQEHLLLIRDRPRPGIFPRIMKVGEKEEYEP